MTGQAVNIINAVPRMMPPASNQRLADMRQVTFDEKIATLTAMLPELIEVFGPNAIRLPDISINTENKLLSLSVITWSKLVKKADEFETFLMTPQGLTAFPPASAGGEGTAEEVNAGASA